MIGLERLRLAEPKIRNLGQYLTLARNAHGHDDIECGDAIRRDEQQTIAQVKDVAHLAALEFPNAGQIQTEHSLVHGGKVCRSMIQLQAAKVAGSGA